MTARIVLLDAKPLGVADVAEIARRNARLMLGEEAMRRIRASRALIEHLTGLGKPMYGVTTGLGACVDTPLAQADLIAFQHSVPLSHSMGIGPALPTEAVRALMAARISGMAAGGTGTSERVVMGLVAALNAGVHPVIPTWGSIGAADLAHLGHMARSLRGDGEAEFQGRIMPSAEALALAGLEPLDLREKDGHAIIVANSLSTGTGCLYLEDVAHLIDWALAAVALNYEAFRSSLTAIDEQALAARPAFGQREIGARLRAELAGSGLWQDKAARRLQDPLSYRCVPQVWGGLLNAFEQARLATEIELTHSGDNPVILAEGERVISNGNFDLTAMTLAWEQLGQALAHCAVGTANRCMKLMSPTTAELPRFLSAKGGSRQGYAELQKPLSALEAEIRHLANPMSLSPLAVSDGIEDQSSMAPRVVAKTAEIVERMRYLVAMELIFAATGVELRGVVDTMGEGPQRTFAAVRALVSPLDDDREMSTDMTRVARMVAGPRC
ncbi:MULTISPECIES: HAL/PAL/TAL family ammonia-lyase [Mesorhizobium]|uniref:Histidine ammonia-lyase n=2 Tax=Mesorhizobium TaxID=68287 RepID=A0A1A5HWZ1_RHILI|nr:MULTISPECIES: histidine ammonia-lyase [Mesorhizobium]ETA71629.1 histidine ammonia-lyase [Mesorhizobium japonicum R7A]MBE1708468.1 histidine ammonia-lyase [Mesorhizobium japonicum]MBE1713637.1 histidine ammonia-lyase [Mesorhizobium japonicum]MUT19787.1 histidine ammonia-lyase [Mesorhizobium japonicum]MUT25757.1 histidine ammonia-lyase [Mesorhizobium japonicum]